MRRGTMAKRDFKVTDLLWPLLHTLLSVGIYLLIVLILYVINLLLNSEVLARVVAILFDIVYIILIMSLVGSYANHFRRIRGLEYVVPFLTSISATLVIWFISTIMLVLSEYAGIDFLLGIFNAALDYILVIFVIILLISYAIFLSVKARMG